MRLVTTEESGTAKISRSTITDYLKTAYEELESSTISTNHNKFVARWVRSEMLNILDHLEANGFPAFHALEYFSELSDIHPGDPLIYPGDPLKDAISGSNAALFWTMLYLCGCAESEKLDTHVSRLVLEIGESIRRNAAQKQFP